jgi:hypothetical protein
MKTFIILVTFIVSFGISPQTKVYQGNSTNYSDCLFTVKGNKIYRGNSNNYSDCNYTIKENKVYRGNSKNYSDCLATIDGILKYSIIAVLIGPY